MNLCVNARDALPDNGRLTLSARRAVLGVHDLRLHSGAKAGPYAVLGVTDTGTGMPPEVLAKIFNPFYTTKEFGKGTGLGLASVTGIVRSHGGFVTVYSELGRGTTFKVHLPATDAPPPDTAAPHPDRRPRRARPLL
jgi:signal transduction histidine kinase